MKAITDGAGVTKGAFYHHFESKEDVLRVIHDEFVDQQLAAMDAVLAAHDDPSDQVRHLLVEFLASTARYRANVAVFFQERRFLTGDRFEAVMEKRHRFDRTFTEVIERGMATGRFRRRSRPAGRRVRSARHVRLDAPVVPPRRNPRPRRCRRRPSPTSCSTACGPRSRASCRAANAGRGVSGHRLCSGTSPRRTVGPGGPP